MADPFRLKAMMALTALLENIKPEDSNSAATGYQHDLTGAVFRGRNIFGDGDPLPMVSILETPIAADQIEAPAEASESSGDWDILIQGFCKDDKNNPSDPAYRLAADVVMALAREKSKRNKTRKTAGFVKGATNAPLGLLTPNGEAAISDILIGSPVCRPPDDVSSKAYFWLRITLRVVEDLENPYG